MRLGGGGAGTINHIKYRVVGQLYKMKELYKIQSCYCDFCAVVTVASYICYCAVVTVASYIKYRVVKCSCAVAF